MTLKPLKWWAKQVQPYYRFRSDLHTPETGNLRIYGLNGDPLHVYTFFERTVYKPFSYNKPCDYSDVNLRDREVKL